jgi:hypothetical protein
VDVSWIKDCRGLNTVGVASPAIAEESRSILRIGAGGCLLITALKGSDAIESTGCAEKIESQLSVGIECCVSVQIACFGLRAKAWEGGGRREGERSETLASKREIENNENLRHFGNFVFSKKWPLRMNDMYARMGHWWQLR